MFDHEGKEVPGNRGYKLVCVEWTKLICQLFCCVVPCFFRYFGAARDLPGVRELFEQQRKFILILSCGIVIC